MKQVRITWASGFIITCMLISSSFLFSSYHTKNVADDLWKMLGISQQSGTEGIKNSFLNGYLYYYGAKNAKNIAVNDRAAIAKDLLDYAKEYISSAQFKKEYERLRTQAKPSEPVLKPVRTIEEIRKEEIARTEKSLQDAEKNVKQATGDMAKAMQPVVDMLRNTLKEYKDPNHSTFAAIEMGEKYQREGEIERYKEYMTRWQKDYPESLNTFIADKLNKMLEATSGIDYNAALVEKYGKKRFVNPVYEGKRTEWKQGFRAGKEVTESARAFAQKWLSELK